MKINFDAPPTSAQETNGLEVRYAAAKRRVPRWRWYLLLAMVLVAPAYLLVRFGIAYWWVSTPAQVVLEQATLRAPAAGGLRAPSGIQYQNTLQRPSSKRQQLSHI